MLSIKVLGPGCDNCQKVDALVRQAVAGLGLAATVEKVTDRALFKTYGLLATPGLVIDEKLVCAGRIPAEPEIRAWLAAAQPAR